jgi:hypothetical protein
MRNDRSFTHTGEAAAMTLADLLTALETRGALAPGRAKDMKTSLRYLAHALGHPDLACPVDAACRDPATWMEALETHFAALETGGRTMSALTRRNSRNNLRTIFRLADEHGLLKVSLPPRLLMKPKRADFERQQLATAPYQTTYRSQAGPRHFGLPQAEWPPDIQVGWREYQTRCGLRIREETFRTYARTLQIYLGYMANICGRTPTWESIFDVGQLKAFVLWHGKRVGRPVSVHGRHTVMLIAAMANVLGRPSRQALAALRREIKAPAPLHIKRTHWVSLAQLEHVAETNLGEGRRPYLANRRVRHPGAQRASWFQLGLMLKVLVRIPLRQRNLREMRLGTNLYEEQGHWHLHFSGSELKIGHRGAQINTYHVDLTDYCPDILPVFKEFLEVHRPRLPNAAASPFVFLTLRGKPFRMSSLTAELSNAVAIRTGQRFYPHLIRTIWATEYISKYQDFATAAVMLGDTLAVVMKTYYDIVHKDHHAKAKAFLSTALQG